MMGRRAKPRHHVTRAAATLGLCCLAFCAKAEEMTRAGAWMTGVNLSGGELNPGKAHLNFDYTYPTLQEIDYFVGKGLKTFRIPVLSERLFGGADGSGKPVTQDWLLLMKLIDHAAQKHARIIVDFHQYGTMPSGLVGRNEQATQDFVDAWTEVAQRLKEKPNVIFGLMNEPHEQSATEWLGGANAAIAAIRAAGARQLILVPGSYWTGAHSWTTTDNASVMLGVVDPAHNFAYEVHQYLDSDSSGTHPDVVQGAGSTRLLNFTKWAREHHARGFLGEFGFTKAPDGLKEGGDLVAYMKNNRDVWAGWTYWAAGPWWGNYMFSLEYDQHQDKPQLRVINEK
jgi:endoglucanase